MHRKYHMMLQRVRSTILVLSVLLHLGSGAAWGQVNLNVGELEAGKGIRISYTTTVVAMPGTDPISNQGTVAGSNFMPIPTDDPDTLAIDDATVTQNVVPVELQQFTIE